MIVYACICRASDTTVLCETTTPGVEGNFAQVSLQLLQVLHDIGALEDETRRTFVHDSGENDLSSGDILDASDAKKMNCSPGSGMESLFNGTAPLGEKNDLSQVFFHCAVYHGVIYLSVTDGAGLTSKAYQFLEEVRTEFCNNFTPSKIDNAKAYGMEKSFSQQLHNHVHNYNTNPFAGSQNGALVALTGKVEDMKLFMGDNISVLLKRGERVENLINKAEELEEQTRVFKKTAKGVRVEMNSQHSRLTARLYGIYTVFIFIASLFLWAVVERIRGN